VTPGPKRDVDVLAKFRPYERVGPIRLAGMEIELSDILGRRTGIGAAQDPGRYFSDEPTSFVAGPIC